MPEPAQKRLKIPQGRLGVAALVIAALAITIALWAGNAAAPRAADCQPQPAAARAIDAAAIGQLAALNGTGGGRGYADLSFTDASGKAITLKDFAGKKLLVNFWASWCIPCRAEMPALDALAARENNDQFMVLPINLDIGAGGLDKAKAFMAEGGFKNLPLYADSTFEAFKRLQTEAVAVGLPTTLILDARACELGVLQGPAEWQTADGTRVIETLKAL